MEGEKSRSDIQSLLEAIRSTEVPESRISLISQLGDVGIFGMSDLPLLADSITTFWEDTACSGISHCRLNTCILHIAAKYLEIDMAICLRHSIILGVKASIWCQKHLQITALSVEEPQEDNHAKLFYQLVLDSLNFSSAAFSALIDCRKFEEQELMPIVEEFILQQLNLTKASVSEVKRFHSIASEVLRVAQVVLDAAIRLCRAYAQAVELTSTELLRNEIEDSNANERVTKLAHVINIMTFTVKKLNDIGILAATGGGSLVMILNTSWKGVITLLQLGKVVLIDKINIGDIILGLISLATESLKSAAKLWSSSLSMEALAVCEAKRTFLPIKFYLINAIRICSQYPSQAFVVYKYIVLCVLMISTFGISLSKEGHLKAASEVLAEFLEPTSFLLFLTLLNSDEVEDLKLQLLDWVFKVETHSSCTYPEEFPAITASTSLVEIFTVTCDAMPKARILMLGRLALFLNITKVAPDLKEDVILSISSKLQCLFDILINEEIYSSVLVLQIPVLCGSGTATELVWNPLFPSILHSLKTFMVVAVRSLAWGEVESFLLVNLLHPHFLCWEIIMELWCFYIRHAETEMINDSINGLISLLKVMASSDPHLLPGSFLRKMARSICILLSYASLSTIDRVYTFIFDDDESELSFTIFTALLLEGFPLNSLSENLIKFAKKRILDAFFCFIKSNVKDLQDSVSSRNCGFGVPGVIAIKALSSMFESLQASTSDFDVENISQVLEFLLCIVHCLKKAANGSKKCLLSELLGQILRIIKGTSHLFSSDKIEEIIQELHRLFKAESSDAEIWFYQCKPALASFMASLGHLHMVEADGSETCSAVWELYHILLREKHWAFVHFALTAFEYFAARSSCDQLWRFVPPDAALSYDLETGIEVAEDRFMSEFKCFLEKEAALIAITPCPRQLDLLEKEGRFLKEAVTKLSEIDPKVSDQKTMDIASDHRLKKKRKVPDQINEGMSLLRSGLKAMGDGLAQWEQLNNDTKALQDEFSNQLSFLEGVVTHLAGLTDVG